MAAWFLLRLRAHLTGGRLPWALQNRAICWQQAASSLLARASCRRHFSTCAAMAGSLTASADRPAGGAGGPGTSRDTVRSGDEPALRLGGRLRESRRSPGMLRPPRPLPTLLHRRAVCILLCCIVPQPPVARLSLVIATGSLAAQRCGSQGGARVNGARPGGLPVRTAPPRNNQSAGSSPYRAAGKAERSCQGSRGAATAAAVAFAAACHSGPRALSPNLLNPSPDRCWANRCCARSYAAGGWCRRRPAMGTGDAHRNRTAPQVHLPEQKHRLGQLWQAPSFALPAPLCGAAQL